MEYIRTTIDKIPTSLLLEADPSQASIDSYPLESACYVAKDCDLIIGACVVKQIDEYRAEVLNIAVLPAFQGQGIGSALLKFALATLAEEKVRRVELGTGSFGYQLTYYQRVGFRVDKVVKDYFLDHYPEPILELGIQHKDMLRLYIDL